MIVEPKGNMPPLTVDDHPKDHPDHVVVRVWYGMESTQTIYTFDDIDSARESLAHHGLVRLDRDPSDDPVIVESWI